jgi:hypothetical protein
MTGTVVVNEVILKRIDSALSETIQMPFVLGTFH